MPYIWAIQGPNVHTEVIRDMSHDLTWRVNSVLANFKLCNSNTKCEPIMSTLPMLKKIENLETV